MITRRNFKKAAYFIRNKARPLDIALFDSEFNDLENDIVIEKLSKYQNPDGGFGHGIEPDIRLKGSSVIATTVALQYVDFARIDPKHIIVEKALNYLVENFHSEGCYWSPTNLDVNNEAHAPWWSIKKIETPKPEEWANPSVEVMGYLNHYSHFVPSKLLNFCNSYIAEYLQDHQRISGFIYYKFLCWKRALPYLPESLRFKVINMLNQTFSDPLVFIKDDFVENHIQWLVTEPSSYLRQKFPDYVDDFLIKTVSRQAEDGAWHPNWKWNAYPNEWEKAKIEWAGKITFETLSVLKNNNLIED